MFGGDTSGHLNSNDLWTLNINTMTWKYQPTRGSIPSARSAHCHVITNNVLWLFGGINGERVFNDVHTLDLETWTWKKVITEGPAPLPRYGATMTTIGKCSLNLKNFLEYSAHCNWR